MVDYEEEIEPEQFKEEQNTMPSKEAYKVLKAQKKLDAIRNKSNATKEEKHKAKFHRLDNMNHYECDNCGQIFKEEEGSLMYKATGEFAYCPKCLKELYPDYKKVKLATAMSKTKLLSNNWDTKYFNGLH